MKRLSELSPALILKAVEHIDHPISAFPKPKELVKTAYQFGQTLILQGDQDDYANLATFWLSCQYWYNGDGEDSFFEELVIDDITQYAGWQQDRNRVGICRMASAKEKAKLDERVAYFLHVPTDQSYLIMNPEWNETKALFMDATKYYLYYFWTGE